MISRNGINKIIANLPGPWQAVGVPSVKPNSPYVLAMMGLPGSGKSTLAKAIHRDRRDAFYIAGENISFAMFKKDKCSSEEYREVYDWIYRAIELIVSSGYGVIFDSTNGLKQYRQILSKKVGNKAKVVFVQLKAPDEVLMARRDKRAINHDQPQSIASAISHKVFKGFKASYEPLDNDEKGIVIDCRISLDKQINAVNSYEWSDKPTTSNSGDKKEGENL